MDLLSRYRFVIASMRLRRSFVLQVSSENETKIADNVDSAGSRPSLRLGFTYICTSSWPSLHH